MVVESNYLKKMPTRQEFYITLPSNVKGQDKNLITNYKTFLKQRLNFKPNEDWRVGLAEVMYTKSWFNVTIQNQIRFIKQDGEIFDYEEQKIHSDQGDLFPKYQVNVIPAGFYPTVTDLIETINYCLKFYPLGLTPPKLHFNKYTNRVTIVCGKFKEKEHFLPIFSEEIENILGITDLKGLSHTGKTLYNVGKYSLPEKEKEKVDVLLAEDLEILKNGYEMGYIMGPRTADINAGISSIYIYSDIVQYSFVGDAYAQLLRTIPVEQTKNWGEVIHHVFDKPHLIPLQSLNFDTVEIDIRDDTGKNIPFEIGRFVVKLLFKKYE